MKDPVTHPMPLIIGDSHAGYMALAFGAYAGGFEEVNQGLLIPVVAGGRMRAECVVINPNKTAFFTQQLAPDGQELLIGIDPLFHGALASSAGRHQRVLVSLEGNTHNAMFMVASDPPFDFHDPRWPAVYQPDHQVVPREAVLQHFEVSARLLEVKLGLLRQHIGDAMPFFWVAPPPPIPSHQHIMAFPEGFRMSESGITHPWVRLKVYRAYVDRLAVAAERAGATVLRAPAACTDGDGFLLPAYWNHCTHATPGYYEALCAQHFPGEWPNA